jgi:hypothetical protein
MPANARKDLVREGEIGTYHCWSRCVQRAFLCGYDPVTERDFDYRRGWIEDLLAYQARVFAIDVGNFNVLSNHLHALFRTRPDLAATWPDEEVALRWKLAWPAFRDGQWIREPTDAELDSLLARPEKIQQVRRRLSSLSWLMARWKEPIARLCNAEMETAGHFWDARFKCRELLDDEAVLTASLYVDLNQIRAGMAPTLEASRHSAIRQRMLAAREQEARASWEDVRERDAPGSGDFSLAQAQTLFADCWLAPIAAEGPLLTTDTLSPAPVLRSPVDHPAPQAGAELAVPALVSPVSPATSDAVVTDIAREPPASPPSGATVTEDNDSPMPPEHAAPRRSKLTRRRASDSPFIAVAISEYLRVARTLATRIVASRQTPPTTNAAGDEGTQDATLHELLARWGMNPAAWLAQFQQLDHQCARALGTAQRVLERARGVAQQRFQGVNLCRALFAAATSDAFT